MKLKTLLEKMKPEVREAIEFHRSLYPNVVGCLCQNLSMVHFVSDMRYEDAMNVLSYYEKAFGKTAQTPWECFTREGE